MRITLLLFLIILTSCSSDKVIELPEIQQAAITELTDISPAYLFYDETQPDSLELNRKNLISTTNWVVNVDKRLTLQQVIPKIQFLQEKKNSSSHKNEAAKNYYTCHDLSQNNLGFIEFTDAIYHLDQNIESYIEQLSIDNDFTRVDIPKNVNSKFIEELINDLLYLSNSTLNTDSGKVIVILHFDKSITFQAYISVKSKLEELNESKIFIDNNEFFY